MTIALRNLRIGTAGWSIPRLNAADLPGSGSHLTRYSELFDVAEINSSFHRPHRVSTYERWAQSVPPGFRFSVKLPKTITHERKLVDCEDLLARFAEESSGLGATRGPILVQLPPKLAFDPAVAAAFFGDARALLGGAMVCEPRHPSWFGAEAERLFVDLRIARVAADPALNPDAAKPGGWPQLAYFRLHGSPVMYRSSYDADALERLAERLRELAAAGTECWTIFDNTGSGAAMADALALRRSFGSFG